MQQENRDWGLHFGALLVLAALAISANAASLQCAANTGVPPALRADGLAETGGDLVLQCTGGTPTPTGQALPQFNFTLLLNTNVTSRVLAADQFAEALLIVDEPASATNPNRPILNCGNAGAPDNGTPGPGVCAVVSSGNPASSYDGTPNAFGAAACDGAGGRPSANTYGCGRPNIFQGRIGTPSSPGQLNAVTFFNVPIDPPGAGAIRVIRITNVRVNAASVGAATTGFYLNTVQATIAATGPIPITISSPQQTLAYSVIGLVSNSALCMPSAPSVIRVCEAFGSVWKAKNISFATGNGIPGNAVQGGSYWNYDGGTNYPPDHAQNVPGSIYNTESAFEWQNNSTNGPPVPNPPYGIGTIPVKVGEVAPLNSAGFGGLNTGINNAGIGDAGTRIALRFTGIPQGASVQVPTLVYIFPTGATSSGTYPNGSTGVMLLTNTDSAGAGAFSPGNGTLAGNLAVYEVLWASPFEIEYAEIPYTLINAPPGATVQAIAGYAPFYSDSGSEQPGAAYPVPRFFDSNDECGGQSCLNVAPSQGVNSGPVQVTLSYYGNQTLTGAQVLLHGAGFADILGTNLSSPAANVLAATFDMTNAPPGARDVIVTPASGPTITLAGGFSVLQSPACAYSVSPQSVHAPATGASGSLVIVASAPQCGWTANTTANWITLPAISPNLPISQSYIIAPNSSSSPLTGSINVAGESIPVTQDAASTCSYGISPGSESFGVNGGMFTVNVTTSPGCAWSTLSNLSWVSFPNGSSGSGSGSVTIQVGANSVGLLSGTLTIAGQPFAVSQDASACGGTDVSRQVTASVQALLSPFNYNYAYTQQLRLTNQGAAVAGPIYVVLYGLCASVGPYFCPIETSYSGVHCQPGAFAPAVLVASNGLAAGQTLFFTLQFSSVPYYVPPYSVFGPSGGPQPGAVTQAVISGVPGQ